MTATPTSPAPVAVRRRPPSRRRGRAVVTGTVLVVACVVGVVVTLGSGPLPVAAVDLVPTLLGDRPLYEYAVIDVGLPRALLAVLAGLALGAAGALTQALTRNPLGSPDLMGFDAGAATGALVAILVIGTGEVSATAAALVAGLATAVVVVLLAGGVSGAGYRLIVTGIAVAALLHGFNAFVLTRTDPREALEGARWLVGTLNLTAEVDSVWRLVVVLLVVVAALLPCAALLAAPLRTLQLGDDVAVAVGVRVRAVQRATLAVAVVLAAAAVSVTGPITFVALAAPPLAASLLRRPGPAVVVSGLMGAALLLYSDLLAQRLVPSVQPPVGVVTGVLGGGYLVWLLSRERNLT